MSLAQLQEIPPKNMVLLVGPPGSGKSTFCMQVAMQRLNLDRPIIYITTECGPFEIEQNLRNMGLGKIEIGLLNFIDAYNKTVGLLISDRSDIVPANSANLTSIGIAIVKQQKRIGKRGILLVFDSLVSPYLLTGFEVVKFMRLTLSHFVAEGNSVLACMDEGCSKEGDLGAMKSLSNGLIEIEVDRGKKSLNVVKHPRMKSTRIEVLSDKIWESKTWDTKFWAQEQLDSGIRFMRGKAGDEAIRKEVENCVNIFWPNLIYWSAMLWDPKRLPNKIYELYKESPVRMIKEMLPLFPWHQKLFLNLFMPKSFSKPKNMKKVLQKMSQASGHKTGAVLGRGDGILEFLEDISKIDEHYFRVHECYECWGFKNVGASMASFIPPSVAGICKGLEKEDRDWNVVETKCIGLGDSYCEFKLVPGEFEKFSLGKDLSSLEKIQGILMDRLMGFLLDDKPLVERPRLGSDVNLQGAALLMGGPNMGGESFRVPWRMGGAKIGKKVGENLLDAEMKDNDAIKRVLHFLAHCKIGKVSMDGTIRIKESCESIWTRYYTMKWEEPLCFFTTGFLNGFFLAVKNQNVIETKCIAMGDPYCEWDLR